MILCKFLITIWVLFYLILVMGFHCDFDEVKDEFLFLSSLLFASTFVTIVWGQDISRLIGG